MSNITRPLVFATRDGPPLGFARLRETCDVVVWEGSGTITQAVLVERVQQCRPKALFLYPPAKVDSELLEAAGPQLKVVGTMSVGLEHVDLEECRRRGVAVGYTPGILTDAVAEHTVGLILAAARNYKPGMKSIHTGVWGSVRDNGLWMAGKEVAGSVLGVVGLGRIGLAVAERLKAFKPSRIIYTGRKPKEYASEVGAEFVPFDELLNTSDFVIAACSINDQNKGLFNKGAFHKMKNTAIFVNVSRGALVNQGDLYDALLTGEIAGAGLDVTSPEPLPPDHRLLKLDNCLVTPHIGSATDKTRNAMCDITVDNIIAGIQGKALPHPAF